MLCAAAHTPPVQPLFSLVAAMPRLLCLRVSLHLCFCPWVSEILFPDLWRSVWLLLHNANIGLRYRSSSLSLNSFFAKRRKEEDKKMPLKMAA